jgi:hypothetical protein
MKLNELVGADSLRQDITNTDSAKKKLLKHGFEMLGDGTFGSVWQHPNLNYVLKLYDEADIGYAKFVELARKHQDNPHFPKFRGLPVTLVPGIRALRLEMLSPWEYVRTDPDHIATDWFLRYIDEPKWRDYLSNMTDEKLKSHIEHFIKKWPDFLHAIELLANVVSTNSAIDFDLHDENIMQRGDCPVIIDPFAPR